MLVFVEGQLWRLLVTSAVGPALWAEERTDERELVNLESRQLGGFYDRAPPRRLRRALVESDVVVTSRIADDGRWLGGLICGDLRLGGSFTRLNVCGRVSSSNLSKVKWLPRNDVAE